LLARLNVITAGDDKFACELAESFLEAAPGCLKSIEEALESADARRLVAEAHALKGISLTIGAEDLAASCQTLEVAGRRESLSDLDVEAARTRLVWNQVRSELESLTSREPAEVSTA
jgi:HPt (histidine-containing phosphotransfer) domain-containing protein